jgi:hypothetical protein
MYVSFRSGPATPGGTLSASTPRGAQPEPQSFIVDNGETEIPVAAIVEEIRTGLDATLRSRAQADRPIWRVDTTSAAKRACCRPR